MTIVWASDAIAFLITAVLCSFLRPIAQRIELLDPPSEPGGRTGGVPLIGGLAMFCGLAFGALTLGVALTAYRSYFAAAAILVVVGVLDDLHELTSRARFVAQIVAAVVMFWWGGIALEDLGAVRPDGGLLDIGAWSLPLTVFATVGVINALNMIDGLDGLAGGLSLIAIGGLVVVATDGGRADLVNMLVLLASVVVAYLCFNVRLPGRPRALVFMGDAGSMLLGFSLCWFLIAMSQGGERLMSPVTALWLLLIPLLDTVWLIVHRVAAGRSPTEAHYDHLHHVLQMAGLGPRAVVLVLWAIAAGAAALGIAAERLGWSEAVMFYGFFALFAVYCAVMAVTWRRMCFIVWPIDRRAVPGDRRTGRDRRRRERRHGAERRAGRDRRTAAARREDPPG